jgi:hypothetical protein
MCGGAPHWQADECKDDTASADDSTPTAPPTPAPEAAPGRMASPARASTGGAAEGSLKEQLQGLGISVADGDMDALARSGGGMRGTRGLARLLTSSTPQLTGVSVRGSM